MRWRHSDRLMSDQLTVGALWSLLWSVFNVKVGCCSELPLLYCDEVENLSRDQGTGTNFSLEPEVEPSEFNDNKAKSILPVVGLRMVSWICPARFPEESFTCAPTSLLARSGCSFIRPVAFRCLVLQLLVF